MRWNIFNEKQFLHPMERGSYEEEIKYLKEFIENIFSIYEEINSVTSESVNGEIVGGWNGGPGGWGFPGGNDGNGQWPGLRKGGNTNGGWPKINQ